MAPLIPTREPKSLVAGDRVQWQRTLTDYSVDAGDVLSYDIVGRAAEPIQISGTSVTGVGSTWTIDYIAPSQLAGGTYEWRARITNGTKRVTVGRGTFSIEANEPVVDGDEALLTVINEVLAGRFRDGIEAYMIAGRSVTKTSADELLRHRGIIEARIWRKRNPGAVCPQFGASFGRR